MPKPLPSLPMPASPGCRSCRSAPMPWPCVLIWSLATAVSSVASDACTQQIWKSSTKIGCAIKVLLPHNNPAQVVVSKVMTPNPLTVSLANSLDECMAIMVHKHIRHLPVLEKTKVIGVISVGDLVKNIMLPAIKGGLAKMMRGMAFMAGDDFAGIAIGLVIDLLEDGQVRRRTRIWWPGGDPCKELH